MGYVKKIAFFWAADLFIVGFSVIFGCFVRFKEEMTSVNSLQWISYSVIYTVVFAVGLLFFQLNQRMVVRYGSFSEMVTIFQIICFDHAIAYLLIYLLDGNRVPLATVIVIFETMLICMGGMRLSWRVRRRDLFERKTIPKRALIVGAGDCGAMEAKRLLEDKNVWLEPIFFIDDNAAKHKQEVCGLLVLGDRTNIVEAVHAYAIDEIILAIPSSSRKDFMEILELCKLTKVKLSIIPPL